MTLSKKSCLFEAVSTQLIYNDITSRKKSFSMVRTIVTFRYTLYSANKMDKLHLNLTILQILIGLLIISLPFIYIIL